MRLSVSSLQAGSAATASEALAAAAAAAKAGAEATKTMTARAGRSSYVSPHTAAPKDCPGYGMQKARDRSASSLITLLPGRPVAVHV